MQNKYLNNKLNIANSESWKDEDYLNFFKQRLNAMKAKKSEIEKEFTICEKQETATSYYNNFWELQVNIPLEQNLIEIYMWRTNGKINYDIVPDWQSDVNELQASKYALNFFLDWNEKENFWIENKDFRQNKALYWTWIFYTWIRSYKEIQYKLKDSVKIKDISEIQNKKNFSKIERERWFLFPKSVHPRDFYVDDNAYNKPWIQNADDCIYTERLSLIEFLMRYGNNKSFNIDSITTSTTDTITIHHYFDRITKTWLIVANQKDLIYNWIYLYDDWKLPFEMVQHYTNPNSIWWRGIPTRIRYLKAYKNEILQDILVWAEMSSWINLLTWNDAQIWQDWEVWGRGINIWRTVWWAQSVQAIPTTLNLSYFTNVINILDDLIIQDTWDNMKAPASTNTDKVGIAEIMEANKQVRQSSVDENYYIWLDNVLTMSLSRIKQFAPSLLWEKIMNKKWDKIIKYIFPKITIPNYRQEKNKFVEDMGKYWYFELKPDTIQWIWVKISTSSTNSFLPIFEREKVSLYIENIAKLFNIAQLDPKMLERLKDSIDFDGLLRWINNAYSYDNNLASYTKKDKQVEENKKKLKEILDIFGEKGGEKEWIENTLKLN